MVGKNDPEERLELLEVIVSRLEWSRLYWRGPELRQIVVCPICTGVEPGEYDRVILKEKNVLGLSYMRGHSETCDYLKLI